ncbi:MAG: hypothetical protein GF416_07510 [Candidatus Altiarchaeales archaeon]|nr:hypothetical protein [Candidatus Altiarchaeales archaeon]MBD3416959.1 hypothetical protein [Candidatus Altiarchaeales archaeon]
MVERNRSGQEPGADPGVSLSKSLEEEYAGLSQIDRDTLLMGSGLQIGKGREYGPEEVVQSFATNRCNPDGTLTEDAREALTPLVMLYYGPAKRSVQTAASEEYFGSDRVYGMRKEERDRPVESPFVLGRQREERLKNLSSRSLEVEESNPRAVFMRLEAFIGEQARRGNITLPKS